MTDIFREVEEEVRRERYGELWKRYGDYFVAGAALMIIGVAGFQLWRVYEQRQNVRASDTYSIAEQMLEGGHPLQAAQIFAGLAQTAPNGYAKISLLQKADSLNALGNTAQAVDTYKEIAAKGDTLLAPVARIRAAWAMVETSPRAEIAATLAPLTDPKSAWWPMAQEILAYADYRAGDMKTALQEFRAISADHDTPNALRQRSDAMATFLAAGGDREFGQVPPEARSAAPAGAAPAQGSQQQ